VTVVGLDRDGFELARSELSLNVGRERFFIRLDPVSAADVDGDRLRVSMQVNTPSESALESLDVYWNDRLLTSLYQPPYEAWVTVGAPGEFGYLRAQALLEDGSQAEDVQFVNAPEFGSIVEVQAVELPVTVLGRDGRPVSDLTIEDFDRVRRRRSTGDLPHVAASGHAGPARHRDRLVGFHGRDAA
jgi:hypothetical protein